MKTKTLMQKIDEELGEIQQKIDEYADKQKKPGVHPLKMLGWRIAVIRKNLSDLVVLNCNCKIKE